MKITRSNTAILGKTLSLLYLGMLFIVFLVPIPNTREAGFVSLAIRTSVDFDFLSHLFTFFVWGYLLTFWRLDYATELIVSFAVAVLLEMAQCLTVHRVFEIHDLVANLVGATLGLKTGLHFGLNYDYCSAGLPSDDIDT